jgi:diguanylate cyclase (GGDEF)-like protein
MEHKAKTDYLTGLYNHRSFQAMLTSEMARAGRLAHPLSLLIVDLDYLKEVNDRFGHMTGDAVIRAVAETIRSGCREYDLPARYGGEEFTVILPETNLTAAIDLAERIRDRIADQVFPGPGHVTASIGVANFPANAVSKEELVRVADSALYEAKRNGGIGFPTLRRWWFGSRETFSLRDASYIRPQHVKHVERVGRF